MKDQTQLGDRAAGNAAVRNGVLSALPFRGHYDVICRDPSGRVKWRERVENLVTNAGEDYALDAALSAGTQITAWYLGLTAGSPTAAEGDTMASHAGWTEDQNYSEAARVAYVEAGVSGQSCTNSASPASFSINGTATIGGVFLTSVSTKGGATGTLFAVGAFTGGNKAVDSGDTLDVTATYTAGGA